jgi:hypothetical protein
VASAAAEKVGLMLLRCLELPDDPRERAEFVVAAGLAFAVCYCAAEPGAPRGGLLACVLLYRERLKKGGDIII